MSFLAVRPPLQSLASVSSLPPLPTRELFSPVSIDASPEKAAPRWPPAVSLTRFASTTTAAIYTRENRLWRLHVAQHYMYMTIVSGFPVYRKLIISISLSSLPPSSSSPHPLSLSLPSLPFPPPSPSSLPSPLHSVSPLPFLCSVDQAEENLGFKPGRGFLSFCKDHTATRDLLYCLLHGRPLVIIGEPSQKK